MHFLNSFKYAISGIKEAFKNEKNMKIHALLAAVAVVLALILKFSLIEWSILILTVGFVFAMEFVNTSLETIVDVVSPEKQEKARIAKDVAAAGVLVSAIVAALIGILLFVPKCVDGI